VGLLWCVGEEKGNRDTPLNLSFGEIGGKGKLKSSAVVYYASAVEKKRRSLALSKLPGERGKERNLVLKRGEVFMSLSEKERRGGGNGPYVLVPYVGRKGFLPCG